MTTKDVRKLNMIRTVEALCNDNADIVNSNAAFANVTATLSANIASIIGTAGAQGKVITGITTDKNIDKDAITQAATDMAGIVFAYASSSNNNTLKEAVDFSYSDINRLQGDLLVTTAKNIYHAANNNLAALFSSGITDVSQAAFNNKIDAYSKSLPAHRTATSERGTQTGNLDQLMRDTINLLKEQMDKLVVVFKDLYPDFVSSYFKARIVIDAPSHPGKGEEPAK